MKIVISGGAGFVGGHLAVRLARAGHDVVCFDNLVRRGSEINLRRIAAAGATFLHGDVRCPEDFLRIPIKPDAVLECCAQTTAVDGFTNPMYDYTNNLGGLFNVLEYCRKSDAGLVLWSTNKVYSGEFCNFWPTIEKPTRFEWDENFDYDSSWATPGVTHIERGFSSLRGFNENAPLNGNQHTVYGATKAAADILVQEWSGSFGVPTVVNRLSCIYGPHQFGKVTQGWIAWFALARRLGLPVSYYGFGGKQMRDCLFVDDLCDLIEVQLARLPEISGSVYNVGGGNENTLSLLELTQKIDRHRGISGPDPIVVAEPRKFDQKIYVSDISKVREELGWSPKTSLDRGLEQLFDWAFDPELDLSWTKFNA